MLTRVVRWLKRSYKKEPALWGGAAQLLVMAAVGMGLIPLPENLPEEVFLAFTAVGLSIVVRARVSPTGGAEL